ncbi:MAG: YIP1 family protein [bacterium]|nr:YIP1 family protein [bacterium]
MNFDAIIKRIINLITKPADEWAKIKSESMTVKDMYLGFAIIVYAIPSVALFLGLLFAGAPFGMTLAMALFLYIFTIGILFLMGIIIDAVAPSFGGAKDLESSHKLAVFSFTPYALLGVLYLIPMRGRSVLLIALVLSLVSIYFLYIGAQKLKNMMPDKMMPFVIIMGVAWLILLYFAQELSMRIAIEVLLSSVRSRMGGF